MKMITEITSVILSVMLVITNFSAYALALRPASLANTDRGKSFLDMKKTNIPRIIIEIDRKKVGILKQSPDFAMLVKNWFGPKRKLKAVNLFAGDSRFAKYMMETYDIFSEFKSIEPLPRNDKDLIEMDVEDFAIIDENQGRFDILFMLAPHPRQLNNNMFIELSASLALLKEDGMIIMRLNDDDEFAKESYFCGIENLKGYCLISKDTFSGLPNTRYTRAIDPAHIIAKVTEKNVPTIENVLRLRVSKSLLKHKEPLDISAFIQLVEPILYDMQISDRLPIEYFQKQIEGKEELLIQRTGTVDKGTVYGILDEPQGCNGPIIPFVFERTLMFLYFKHNIDYGKYNAHTKSSLTNIISAINECA